MFIFLGIIFQVEKLSWRSLMSENEEMHPTVTMPLDAIAVVALSRGSGVRSGLGSAGLTLG